MAPRNRYRVTKRSWVVSREGSSRPSVVTPTKSQAIERGRTIAQNAGRSQLIIHRGDGVIQEERTYGGGDPFPPAG